MDTTYLEDTSINKIESIIFFYLFKRKYIYRYLLFKIIIIIINRVNQLQVDSETSVDIYLISLLSTKQVQKIIP